MKNAFGAADRPVQMTTLLVCDGGGHLKQLHRLRSRIASVDFDDTTWVTYDTALSRSLLDGEDVVYVPYTPPRSIVQSVRNVAAARSLIEKGRFDLAISTGSRLAVSFLPVARARGASTHYIETAARVEAPSLSGRIVRALHTTHMYTQYRSWARPPWKYRGSVFDGFGGQPVGDARRPQRFVVSFGTEKFGFERLLRRLVGLIPTDAEVLWQIGATDAARYRIDARATVPTAELDAAMRDADVVISHAGCGAALSALEAGRCPILVPRRVGHDEHIDDHQTQLAANLAARDIAIARDADRLDQEDLLAAAQRRVVERADVTPYVLDRP